VHNVEPQSALSLASLRNLRKLAGVCDRLPNCSAHAIEPVFSSTRVVT
jgi:hypothetical protein